METATDWTSPMEFYMAEVWDQLEQKEKSVCLNYKRQLVKEMKLSRELMVQINIIHEKYPDFHIGCIP